MQLGDAAQITRGVKSIDECLPFYEKFGFKLIGRDTKPYPWAQITDGNIKIVLGEDGNEYMGATWFAKDMSKRGEQLESLGVELQDTPFNVGDMYQKIFVDPNGFASSIIEYDAGDQRSQDTESHAAAGTLGELAIPVTDLGAVVEFWKKLGFEHKCPVFKEPYKWTIMSDGLLTFGFHETDWFTSPALTYFAKDSAERIKKLQEAGVAFSTEGMPPAADGELKNAIATAPDGQVFFVFEGELQ
ncbi:MAG: hypothetical protein CL946_13335 [Ectothiorhodospiraceae bacterium]|nr:hypothetical protein [Ectothiorhodospiraceae bacterium]